jgi:hypothetical protein
MEGQGDSCRVEPLGERGSNSAVGFDMCLTLAPERQAGRVRGRKQRSSCGLSTRGACSECRLDKHRAQGLAKDQGFSRLFLRTLLKLEALAKLPALRMKAIWKFAVETRRG